MNAAAFMKYSAAQHCTPCVANNLQKTDAEGNSRCMNIAIYNMLLARLLRLGGFLQQRHAAGVAILRSYL